MTSDLFGDAPPPGGFGVSVELIEVAARIVHVAELAQRLFARRGGGRAAGHQGQGALVEVEAQLIIHIGADAARRTARELEEAPHHAGSSTRKTAAA